MPKTADFEDIWRQALARYREETGDDLLKLHFANKLLSKCNTSAEAVQLLRDQNDNFKSFRAHGKKILDVLEPFVHFVHRFIDAGAEAAAASVRRRLSLSTVRRLTLH
jgi:hypothetical protein